MPSVPNGLTLRCNNAKDGAHLNVLIVGRPTGDVVFYVGRLPGGEDRQEVDSGSITGTNPFAITVPHPLAFWYVWVEDDNGFCAAADGDWVDYTGYRDIDEIGYCLRDRIVANQIAIEKSIQAYFPDQSLKQILYGSASAIREFPALLVTKPRRDPEEYVAAPMVQRHTYTFDIYCFILHQEKTTQVRQASQFMASVMSILNQPHYTLLKVNDSYTLDQCLARSGEADDSELDTGKWAAVGSLVWSGEGFIQDYVANRELT